MWPQASVNAKPQKMPDDKFHNLDCSLLANFVDICCELPLASLRGIIVAAHAQLVATLPSLVKDPPAWPAIGQAEGVGRWAGGNGTKQMHLHRQTISSFKCPKPVSTTT